MPPHHLITGSRARAISTTMIVAAALALASGCERDSPTTPGGSYSVSGRVRLTGFLVDANGGFAGTRVVEDADGVSVELRYGTSVVARTTTVDGVYRFDGVGPGAYRTGARVVGNIGDETGNLTVASADVNVSDTLRLTSVGDLLPWPNPSLDSVYVYFEMPDTQFVELQIRDMAGGVTRVLFAEELPTGPRRATWNGFDGAGGLATQPLYWVTYQSAGETRAHLLFR